MKLTYSTLYLKPLLFIYSLFSKTEGKVIQIVEINSLAYLIYSVSTDTCE